MKARTLIFGFFVAAVTSAHAGSVSYARCGTYDSYLFIYRTTEKFEELGKLRCQEKVEVLSHSDGYSQIRTLDGAWAGVTPPITRIHPWHPHESSRSA